jgi:hypothetical protein
MLHELSSRILLLLLAPTRQGDEVSQRAFAIAPPKAPDLGLSPCRT